MGHFCLLQVRSISVGHSSPPWAASVSTSKVRDWTPVPQDLEQEVQEFQECAQSMGQGWELQVTAVLREGQERPPYFWVLMTERVLELTPPPQRSVQALRPDQPETLQSMGQAWRLQVRVWRSVVQSAPPWAAELMTDLVRYMVPVPQDLVQLL
jgi:hypothetical protein